MLPLLWLGLAIIAGAVEILSPSFGFIFVTAASMLSALAAWIGVSAELQLVSFVATLAISWVGIRPRLAKRLRSGAHPSLPSRTDRLLGQAAQVTQAIDPIHGGGRVIVAGEDWAARSTDPIAVGTKVIVDSADGIVLHVTPDA